MPASTAPKNDPTGTATIKRFRPCAPGTKRLLEQYGDALVCVRYRLDTRLNRRLTTVELIVDDRPKKPEKTAWLRVSYGETELRQRVKEAGGEWHLEHKLWQLPLKAVKALGLERRVVTNV